MIKRRIYWPSEDVDVYYYGEQVDELLQQLDYISHFPIDFINHIARGKNGYSVGYSAFPDEQLLEIFNVQPYHDIEYGYEMEQENGNTFFKLFDKALINHPLPELPIGAKIANMIVVYNSAGISKMRELEFVLNDKWHRICYDVDSLTIVSRSTYEVEENEL